jgi:hypothetical protein
MNVRKLIAGAIITGSALTIGGVQTAEAKTKRACYMWEREAANGVINIRTASGKPCNPGHNDRLDMIMDSTVFVRVTESNPDGPDGIEDIGYGWEYRCQHMGGKPTHQKVHNVKYAVCIGIDF